jgi:hypothetical protein
MQSVISKREIPKDLQGVVGMRSGFDVPSVQHIRLALTGQPGVGKSTFLNSNPYLLSLDPERGGDTAVDPQALRFSPPPNTDPAHLDEAYVDFVDKIIARKKAGHDDIRMIALDTIDEFIDIFLTALCLKRGIDDPGDTKDGRGNGYTIVRKAVFGMLDKIHRAGMGWSIVAHTKTKTIRVGSEERQVSDLAVSDSFKGAIFQKCEHMLFLERGVESSHEADQRVTIRGKEIVKKGRPVITPVRRLKAEPGGLWHGQGAETNDVKVRVPIQSGIILPKVGGWDQFTKAYEDAVSVLTGDRNV